MTGLDVELWLMMMKNELDRICICPLKLRENYSTREQLQNIHSVEEMPDFTWLIKSPQKQGHFINMERCRGYLERIVSLEICAVKVCS